jgi:hypothetical protein
MAIQRDLKAFVRYDGSGRVVAGSLILRKNKPKVGRWQEIPAYECCNYIPTTTTTTTASPTTTTTSSSTSTSTSTTTSTSTSTTTTTTTQASISVGTNSESCGTPSTFVDVSFVVGSNICDTSVQLQGSFSTFPSEFYIIYGGFSRLVIKISDSIIQGAGGAPGECVSCG